MSTSHDHIENFLYTYTDAMLANDDLDAHALAYEYDIPVDEANAYAALLTRLDTSLVDVQPSKSFKRTLREDLLGKPQLSLAGRLRNLPPRLQFAAAIALLAAMALLGRRRMSAELGKLVQQLRSSEGPSAEGAKTVTS
ncbi:MAG: hypothetical protein AAF125_12270 [Chloroflexota bacterium]